MSNRSYKEDPILLSCTTSFERSNSNGSSWSSVQTVGTLSELKTPRLSRKNLHGESYDISSKNDQRFQPEKLNYASGANKANKSLAVSVRNLYHAYEDKHPIIYNLSMSVNKGTIYGLLGSSGCGKTTLLNCIVGLKQWDAGDILVFNKRPGSKESGIPGRRLGFMPQDTALYGPLSIKEMIEYYGRLFGMPETEVAEQIKFLVNFLKLPSKFKLIRDLSGGQKRRVSLALALVHSPELVILDEPTVGLDPVLRRSIWEYLYKMVDIRKTTVIITTHYIEEARFSNMIGVMRKGRLLVENSPDNLMKQFNCDLLEQVVLKLCQKDELLAIGCVANANQGHSNFLSSTNKPQEIIPPEAIIINGESANVRNSYSNLKNSCNTREENWQLYNGQRSLTNMNENEADRKITASSSSMFQRIRALSTVMWLLLFRHPAFTCITIFVPAIQILLTVAVIGKDPKGIKLGIVNQEFPEFPDPCLNYKGMRNQTEVFDGLQQNLCEYKQLSCSFISELKKSGNVETIPKQSSELAYQQVKEGKLLGYIVFPPNYSEHLANLKVEQMFARNETLEGSRVRMRLDMSNYLSAAIALRFAFKAYENFVTKLAISCGIDPREFLVPLLYREPVYGKNEGTYHDYISPIIFMTVIFEIPMVVTAILFISDRKQGTLERARVAGLQFKEVMGSYMVTQVSIIILQALICYGLMRAVHDMQVLGSMTLYFGVTLLFGVCALSMGLFLGIFMGDEVEALVFAMFLGPALIFFEGALWPLEAIPWIPWRILSYASPTTLMCSSFRSIVTRGLGLTHPLVWPGIAVVAGYTVLFCALSALFFVRKTK